MLGRHSTRWWWTAAVALFWSATVVFVLADYLGAVWFGIVWTTGADLFPNRVLGVPLAVCQLLAAALLVAAAVRLARGAPGIRGMVLAVALAVGTAVVCFVAFALAALWYHADVLGRSL